MEVRQLPGYKPLCFLKSTLYLYKKGYVYRMVEGKPEKIIRIYPRTIKESVRILSRLYRTEPKYAVPINESKMIVVGHHKIEIVDVEKKNIEVIALSRSGFSDPLNVCKGNEKWVVLWGDYGSNAEHDSINIYGLTQKNQVEKIYTFKNGQVRHIHNIIPKLSGGYYIFAGDQEFEAGIYEASPLFDVVKPVKIGKQQYRAVIGFDTPNGLLYATDAVNEKNNVYLLQEKDEPQKICRMEGSCIYGVEFKGKYYFSTTVEPDENNHRVTSWLLSKRGKGILSDEVCLVEVDDEMSAKTLVRYKKDIFPMKLMQYGAIQFPKGGTEEFWCYPVAVKKYDGIALRLM